LPNPSSAVSKRTLVQPPMRFGASTTSKPNRRF
jgi:hypothetical protein